MWFEADELSRGIQDLQDALGEIRVSVLGISKFKADFGNHPDYNGYYGLT